MIFIFGGTVALFLVATLMAWWHLRWMRRLPSLETFGHVTGDTHCSVVIAARNEETRIEQTIRCLLAQRDVNAEIVVVDDRSTDRTNEILQQLAKEDSRLRFIRIEHYLTDGSASATHVRSVRMLRQATGYCSRTATAG